jgi:hypothetical protein
MHLSMKLDGTEQVRKQEPVHDEAGDVRHLDWLLIEGYAQLARTATRVLTGLLGEHELDQLHPRHRVEHVQPREPFRTAGRLRQLRDRQRRSRRRDHGAVVGVRAELGQVAEDRGLAAVMLDDSLDEERRLLERVQVGDDPHETGIDLLALEAGAVLGDGALRALG